MLETYLLQQKVAEESQQEEVEVATLQREKQKRAALEDGLEQMVAAQQELEGKNRRPRAEAGEVAHQQFREQIRSAQAAAPEPHELTQEEIIRRVSAAIRVGQPLHTVESAVPGYPPYQLAEQEYRQFQQGRGGA